MSHIRKIAAHYILCPRSGLIPRPILTFDDSGRLLAVDTDVSKLDSMCGIEFFSGILIPGLVNAHCHLELSYLQGKIKAGIGLDGFVRQIAKIRQETLVEDRIYDADVQDSLMWKEGIAAVADICNDSFTFPTKRKSLIHYHSFVELFGADPAVAESTLDRGIRLTERLDQDKMSFSLTPHSTYSLSEPLFEGVARKNKDMKPLSVHFMESTSEEELFRSVGLFAERYRSDGISVDLTSYESPAGRLIQTFPPETPLLLIHNTFVREEDIDRIQAYFKDVTWVICPRSNDYIEGMFPPVDLLRRKGCRIAVGTDGLSSNTSLSMLEELKFLSQKQPGIALEELIRWSTENGAEALGISSWAGSFEVGKAPGAVLIDHMDWDKMALTPESTARRII